MRERLTSLFEVLLCSGFPTQLIITLSLVQIGIPVFDGGGGLSLRHIVLLSMIDTVVLVSMIVVFLRARGESARRVFLGNRSAPREAGRGLLLLPAALLLVVGASLLIERAAPWLKSPAGNPLADLLQTTRNILVFGVVAIVAGGLREEVQRAFILHRFEQHLGGAMVGLVIFSAAFGFGHALQGWDAAIVTALLGAFWGVVYLRRRSIVAPAVCHAVFNIVEIVSHGLQP